MPKIYMVTQTRAQKSKTVGFVSVFGWESADKKAVAKYPNTPNIQVHEYTFRRGRASVK